LSNVLEKGHVISGMTPCHVVASCKTLVSLCSASGKSVYWWPGHANHCMRFVFFKGAVQHHKLLHNSRGQVQLSYQWLRVLIHLNYLVNS
jgi:hypothetical protein